MSSKISRSRNLDARFTPSRDPDCNKIINQLLDLDLDYLDKRSRSRSGANLEQATSRL